jgi:hypothetical protein
MHNYDFTFVKLPTFRVNPAQSLEDLFDFWSLFNVQFWVDSDLTLPSSQVALLLDSITFAYPPAAFTSDQRGIIFALTCRNVF